MMRRKGIELVVAFGCLLLSGWIHEVQRGARAREREGKRFLDAVSYDRSTTAITQILFCMAMIANDFYISEFVVPFSKRRKICSQVLMTSLAFCVVNSSCAWNWSWLTRGFVLLYSFVGFRYANIDRCRHMTSLALYPPRRRSECLRRTRLCERAAQTRASRTRKA